MKSTIRLGVILFLICAIAAASLAFFADITEEPIARQLELETQSALRGVAPEATDFRVLEDGSSWEALHSGETIARIYAVTAKGYAGPIGIIAGVGGDGRLTGVRVVRQTETAGLGNKIATEGFLRQFVGLSSAELWLRKDKAQGAVDAIAAATISSRAVTNALRAAAGGR